MMKYEKEYAFLGIIGDVINLKEVRALPEGVSADDILAIGFGQDMAPITFCALNSINNPETRASLSAHQERFLSDCTRSEVQMEEYDRLISYLCENGVKLLPLKGCVIKKLYPAPSLRVMSDIDLLYEGAAPKELARLMGNFGYSAELLERGCHEVFHKKPCMNIELHRKLVKDDSPYKSVLENLFDKAVPDKKISNLYHLKPEDLYIHVVVHAAKHFKESGLGVRPVLDFYVLNRKYSSSWDRGYLDRQFASVGLDSFEKKMRDIAYAFFGEELTEVLDEDVRVFFQGSTYGNGDCSAMTKYAAIASGNSKASYILKRIFMPLSEMKSVFPVLNKHPYLYPFVSVYRWIIRLVHRTSREKLIMLLTRIPKEEADEIRQTMKSFGLD